MYLDQSTNTVVKEEEGVSLEKTTQNLGVVPSGEIISAEKIRVKNDNGTNTDSVIYTAKG